MPPMAAWYSIINNIIVSGEATLSDENSERKKTFWAVNGSAPNPAGDLTALPIPPSWWEGVAAPPKEPYHPRSRP